MNLLRINLLAKLVALLYDFFMKELCFVSSKEIAVRFVSTYLILPHQVVDSLDLAQATMAKVYQNLSWAVAYNIVAIPIAAGVLLPQYDLAMTPSFSGM